MGEIKATIQFKRATSSKWAQLNPILAKGEPGYETDTGKLKIGDGTSTWQSLKYLITEELDPTVPEWAKQENKPTYTASEVGAYNKSEVDTKLNSKANSSHTHTMANISDLKNQVPKNATRVSSGYDLNNYNSSTHCGYYYAGGSNNCLSKPSGVDAFGLQIVKNADGYIMQILYASNNSKNDIYTRVYGGGAWTGWEKLAQSGDLTWANLSGKPSTFTPSSHTHGINNITNLQNELDNKAPISDPAFYGDAYVQGKLYVHQDEEVPTKTYVDTKYNQIINGFQSYSEKLTLVGGDDWLCDWNLYDEVEILMYFDDMQVGQDSFLVITDSQNSNNEWYLNFDDTGRHTAIMKIIRNEDYEYDWVIITSNDYDGGTHGTFESDSCFFELVALSTLQITFTVAYKQWYPRG